MSPRAPRFELEGRDWPHRESSRFLHLDGHRVHVQVVGAGPAMLLLHGTGASCHSFGDLVSRLCERFTLVVPDLPRHGFSTSPASFSPTLPATARLLRALLHRLELSVDVVVGHSAGAAVAMQLVLDDTIQPRRLVGLAAALMPFRGLAGVVAPAAARVLARTSRVTSHLLARRARSTVSVERLVASTGSRLTERGVELYRRLASSPGHVDGVLAMVAAWDVAPLWPRLPTLHVPVLLVAGERDRAIPSQQLRELLARLPDARLEVVKGAGHLLHEEQPAVVARLIREGLA